MPALVLSAFARAAAAQEAASPSDATVFIRVIGVVHAEFQRAWKETVRDARDRGRRRAAGSWSRPAGYVLTNEHVVSG